MGKTFADVVNIVPKEIKSDVTKIESRSIRHTKARAVLLELGKAILENKGT